MTARWRLGTRNPFTVYRVADGAHDVDHAREHFVTSFRREEDARLAVDAVNGAPSVDEITRVIDEAFDADFESRMSGGGGMSREDMARDAAERVTDLWPAQPTPPSCDCPDTDGAVPAGSAVGQRGAPTRDAFMECGRGGAHFVAQLDTIRRIHARRADDAARLARALGVFLDPDDPDPVGRLVAAAGKAREVEVVSGAEALALLPGSIVVACYADGSPAVAPLPGEGVCEPRVVGVGLALISAARYRVLYRAPAPAPAALAVGEVVDTAAKFATLPESARLVPCDEEGQPMVDMQVVTPQSYLGEWDAASDDAPFVILTLPVVRVGTGGGES